VDQGETAALSEVVERRLGGK